jgi:hypothetical protein
LPPAAFLEVCGRALVLRVCFRLVAGRDRFDGVLVGRCALLAVLLLLFFLLGIGASNK